MRRGGADRGGGQSSRPAGLLEHQFVGAGALAVGARRSFSAAAPVVRTTASRAATASSRSPTAVRRPPSGRVLAGQRSVPLDQRLIAGFVGGLDLSRFLGHPYDLRRGGPAGDRRHGADGELPRWVRAGGAGVRRRTRPAAALPAGGVPLRGPSPPALHRRLDPARRPERVRRLSRPAHARRPGADAGRGEAYQGRAAIDHRPRAIRTAAHQTEGHVARTATAGRMETRWAVRGSAGHGSWPVRRRSG